MPRFELENVGSNRYAGVVRARDMADAVRRNAKVSGDETVELEPDDELQGWMHVIINGERSGRIRVHDRMRFRRD